MPTIHLQADAEADKARFIQRVRQTRQVWGLKSLNGWANCPTNEDEDRTVLVFWSDEAYARRHAVAEWSDYVPTPIDLDSFIDSWLRGMAGDGSLVGVDFNAELAGLEIEPIELARFLT